MTNEIMFFRDNLLTQYTTPPNNYIGSILFLSYIIAALCLTAGITYSLYTQYVSVFQPYPSSPPSRSKEIEAGRLETRKARARHIKIYTALALISFISISWHMLSFLVTSFVDWSNTSSRNILTVLGGTPFHNLKHWMLETGLFKDFATQLVANGESAVWSQLAILSTWGWNLWLGLKGRQYGFTTKTMLPFIILGQNLPIIFTVALFIIQLHLSAPDVIGPKRETKSGAQPRRRPVASSLLPTIILNALLLAQPSLQGHSGFSYLILAVRALLFLPHVGLLKLSDADIKKSAAVSGGFVVANWTVLRKSLHVEKVATALVWEGQAVKTMGWDAVLSLVVYGVLSWGGGV